MEAVRSACMCTILAVCAEPHYTEAVIGASKIGVLATEASADQRKFPDSAGRSLAASCNIS